MAVTTHRPVPLPGAAEPTFADAVAAEVAGKAKLPAGATRMSRTWLDDNGLPQHSAQPVPVDAGDRRTPHRRHQCPHLATVPGGEKERCGHARWLLPGETRFCPAHGDQLAAPAEQPSRVAATARRAVELYGRSAAPWALPVAALAADALCAVTGVGAVGPLTAAPVLAGGAYLATRRTLTARAVRRGRIERGQRAGRRVARIRRTAVRAGATAGEWSLWAAALAAADITNWAGLVVAAAGAARWAIGMLPWWNAAEARRLRALAPPPVVVEAPPEPEPEPDPVQVRAVTTWATLIGAPDKPLAGTELVEWRRLPACDVRASVRTRLPNWTAKVVARVPGSINMRENRPLLRGRIAAAYACTYADVSFSADESDLSVGWLRVQPDNVLAETRMWTGPAAANDWKNGRSRIGRFDDGADVLYQWWTNTGAAHDLISGCSGSGKSELVAQLILAGLHSDGLVLDWLGDPQGGQSYGALKDYVDWFARDKTEITLMLLAALKEMLRRNDELTAKNIKTWKPTRAMPLLVITLDEVQSYIDDPAILELVEKLVGQGRKCGIKMRLITQVPAAYNLGGSTYIKEQLKIGQTLIFRAMTDVAGRSAVEGDCPIDPTELPTVWGKNTCAAGETTAGLLFAQGLHGRDVYGRADYTGDDMMCWLVDPDGDPTINPGRFGPEAQQESGVLWGDRKERAKRSLAAGRADADLLSGGKAVDLINAAAVSAATGAPVRLAEPAGGDGKGGAPRARDVVLTAARELADEHGRVTREQIAAAVRDKMANGTRDKALTDLVADSDLRRVRNGVYEVPPGSRVTRQAPSPVEPTGDQP